MRHTNLDRLKMYIQHGAAPEQEAIVDAYNELKALREWAADAREYIDGIALFHLVTDDDRRPGERLRDLYDENFSEAQYLGTPLSLPIQPGEQVELRRVPNGARVRRDRGSPILMVVGNFPNDKLVKMKHGDEYVYWGEKDSIYEVISVPEEYYENYYK